jgi:vacuolar protein sorting-associated protein 13A/C
LQFCKAELDPTQNDIVLACTRFIVVPFFCRRTDTEESSLSDVSEEQRLKEERLTTEEWQAINKLLSFQPEEELIRSTKDVQNMVQFMVTVSIGQAAARIISVNQVEIVCARFEQLDVSTKFRHRSVYCDVLLKFYGLSAPEGSLTQVCFFAL